MDWGVADVFKLIELYKRYYCLWDRNSAGYKKLHLKNKAWNQIAKEMKKSVDDVKKKVKNIRSCYLFETKKVGESLKMSTSPEEVYTPHLFYYEKMRFLDNVVVLRNPLYSTPKNYITPVRTSNDIEIKNIESNETISNNIVEFSPEDDVICTTNKEENFSERSFVYEDSTEDSLNLKPIKKAKIEKQNKLNATSNNETLDHANHAIFSSFAKSIELQLSHLPIALATKAMAEMQQILAIHMGKIDCNEYANRSRRK